MSPSMEMAVLDPLGKLAGARLEHFRLVYRLRPALPVGSASGAECPIRLLDRPSAAHRGARRRDKDRWDEASALPSVRLGIDPTDRRDAGARLARQRGGELDTV